MTTLKGLKIGDVVLLRDKTGKVTGERAKIKRFRGFRGYELDNGMLVHRDEVRKASAQG